MLWWESSKDCILLGLIDSDTYLHEFRKLVQNKWSGFIMNLIALHYMPPFGWNNHYWNISIVAVSEFTGHLAIWWGCSVCVNILWKWHHRPPAHHKWGPEGVMGAEQQCSPSPWGWKVEHISSVSDLVYITASRGCVSSDSASSTWAIGLL